MTEKLTKQGVRNLNPKGYNGRRYDDYEPQCQHNWSEDQIIGVRDVGDGIFPKEAPVYGKRCLLCKETRE